MDHWKLIDLYPPGLVRLLARRRVGKKQAKKSVVALSDQEIAITSGIPTERIRAIYNLRSWHGIPVGDMRAFFIGCNFDPLKSVDRNRSKAYLCSKPNFIYLKKSPHWSTIFLPLINRLRPK